LTGKVASDTAAYSDILGEIDMDARGIEITDGWIQAVQSEQRQINASLIGLAFAALQKSE
jgi:hypothetical protein